MRKRWRLLLSPSPSQSPNSPPTPAISQSYRRRSRSIRSSIGPWHLCHVYQLNAFDFWAMATVPTCNLKDPDFEGMDPDPEGIDPLHEASRRSTKRSHWFAKLTFSVGSQFWLDRRTSAMVALAHLTGSRLFPADARLQIDQLVAWGGKFLRAASTKPEIMQLMLGLGYSEEEHKEGWDLYLKMLGYRGAGATPAPVSMSTTEQLRALSQIDSFDEPAFRRTTAALGRLHPEQHRYFFGDGLAPKTGPESLGSVQTFLERYAALRDGTDPNRADTRDADHAAAKTLELATSSIPRSKPSCDS